jgi:hypothetical protein
VAGGLDCVHPAMKCRCQATGMRTILNADRGRTARTVSSVTDENVLFYTPPGRRRRRRRWLTRDRNETGDRYRGVHR